MYKIYMTWRNVPSNVGVVHMITEKSSCAAFLVKISHSEHFEQRTLSSAVILCCEHLAHRTLTNKRLDWKQIVQRGSQG
jgi:hypothetical protein